MIEQVIPHFVLWKWHTPGYRTPYTMQHANTMVAMLLRNHVPLERIHLVTDDPRGSWAQAHPIWSDFAEMKNRSGKHLPSCYRRLKLFSSQVQTDLGIPAGARVVSLDLDAVVLHRDKEKPQDGWLKLFQRPEKFVGWGVPSHIPNRVVFNGSMWMFTAGEFDWVWENFNHDPVKAIERAFEQKFMGSDQAYISHMMVNRQESGCWTSTRDGVMSYTRDVRALKILHKHTRVVFFAGTVKPWDPSAMRSSPWITRYWYIDKEHTDKIRELADAAA